MTLPDAEALGEEIATLCSCIYAAEARLLERVRQFDAAGCYEKLGFHSTAHWLNYRCGIGMNAAREKLRVANALPALPMIREAFAAGNLSYSKVRAMTRVATPETEAYLLDFATYGTAHHVEKLVAKTRRAQRLQAKETAEAVYAGRELTLRHDENGALVLQGRFPAEQGAIILKALEKAMDSIDVSAETSTGGDAADVTAETSERPSFSSRRADALAEVAETFLSNSGHNGTTADRYQVVVHVAADVTAETSPSDVTAVTSQLDDGSGVTAETSRRIACDCSVVPVREDPFGEPLSIGRKTRSIPPAIRRALQLRDGGCRFPGCTHTRFVDGHHIKHWADGGETSLENLVLLCRRHHRLVHEGGYGVERRTGGEIVFTDTGRRTIPAGMPLPDFATNIDAWIDRQVFEGRLDHDGCRAKLDATDQVDWDLATAPLLS